MRRHAVRRSHTFRSEAVPLETAPAVGTRAELTCPGREPEGRPLLVQLWGTEGRFLPATSSDLEHVQPTKARVQSVCASLLRKITKIGPDRKLGEKAEQALHSKRVFQCSQAVEVPEVIGDPEKPTLHQSQQAKIGCGRRGRGTGTPPAGETLDGEDGGPASPRVVGSVDRATVPFTHYNRPSLATTRTQNQLLPRQKAEAEGSDSADSSAGSRTWRQEQHRCSGAGGS